MMDWPSKSNIGKQDILDADYRRLLDYHAGVSRSENFSLAISGDCVQMARPDMLPNTKHTSTKTDIRQGIFTLSLLIYSFRTQ